MGPSSTGLIRVFNVRVDSGAREGEVGVTDPELSSTTFVRRPPYAALSAICVEKNWKSWSHFRRSGVRGWK